MTFQRKPVSQSEDPYQWAHDQVRQVRGRPSEHRCCMCGEPAEEWSLVAEPQGNLEVVRHNDAAYWFSDDIWDYEPACISCHREKDAGLRQRFEHAYELVLDPPAYWQTEDGYSGWT